MTDFTTFGLSENLIRSLTKMNFTTPTPIQSAAIPLALQGRDILGSAQTGTGKTGAFGIPLIEMLLRDPSKTALVLTPTRELAQQVLNAIRDMVSHLGGMKTAFIIGGDPYGKQLAQLKANPRIIVGTPGRVNDHLNRKTMDLSNAGFLVLDETDRMLDMGFGVQLDAIMEYMPTDGRQTMMFSATMPQEIIRLSSKYLTNPERVSMGNTNIVAPKIKQEIMRIRQEQKYPELLTQLSTREGSVIIFVKTKHGTEKLAKSLCNDGHEADALHGDLRQSKRSKVMLAFRNQKFRILVATDIAARGLDVPHIEHVINHDLPQVAEDYIHRMGRTARGGAEGSALCFISPADYKKWSEIEKLLGIKSDRPASNENRFKKTDGEKNRWRDNKGKPSRGKPSYAGGADKSSRSDRPTYAGKSTKPFAGKDGKPFEKREGKPFEQKSDKPVYGDKPSRPFAAKDGKPFEKRDGKPFEKRGDKPAYAGKSTKPFAGKDGKPAGNRDGKPFEKRGDKPAYAGKSTKPFAGKDGKPAGNRDGKPAFKKFDSAKNNGGQKPAYAKSKSRAA